MAVPSERRRRRALGEHLTPQQLLHTYILPEITPLLTQYRWVDLFAGRGDLILPILEQIPPAERAEFFAEHIRLYDIQPQMVAQCIQRAVALGVPEPLARENIRQQDTLAHYPEEILRSALPVYHVTNPPYLYLGYIPKQPETRPYLQYFTGDNEGYQDLYQIALINDMRHRIPRMAYIIPSNFLFGFAISNKIRDDLLTYYTIRGAYLFEEALFEHTGVHVMIGFFERKPCAQREVQAFEATKINHTVQRRLYRLSPKQHYRAGGEFEEFTARYRAARPLQVSYYLHHTTVEQHRGEHLLRLIDANDFSGKGYRVLETRVDAALYEQVRANPLFVRTLDTGSADGRAGLYSIPEQFGVDGIVVTKATYRTHPIQLFIEPRLPLDDLLWLKDYFNLLLEYLRAQTDSEFMTTYKYSESAYTRKYLGLSQAKALIETFPYLELTPEEQKTLRQLVRVGDAEGVVGFLNLCTPCITLRNFMVFKYTLITK
ncbi:MAG: N-6 DNA methylase [Fimbriimonadales bacterium]|nr:MAG: hypothetical protein KatS3mg018_0157 [Fimbriimonadales bacterium]